MNKKFVYQVGNNKKVTVTLYAAWLSVQQFDLLPTRHIYVSDVDLRTNSIRFSLQP